MMSQPSPSSRHFALQQLGVALVLVAEAEVMTGDEVHRAVVADEHPDISPPTRMVIIAWSNGREHDIVPMP